MKDIAVEYLGGSGFLVTIGETGFLFDASEHGQDPRVMPERADLSAFADAADVPSWALAEMQWANAAQLILGRDGKLLAPNAETTRAEMASILSTFIGK